MKVLKTVSLRRTDKNQLEKWGDGVFPTPLYQAEFNGSNPGRRRLANTNLKKKDCALLITRVNGRHLGTITIV